MVGVDYKRRLRASERFVTAFFVGGSLGEFEGFVGVSASQASQRGVPASLFARRVAGERVRIFRRFKRRQRKGIRLVVEEKGASDPSFERHPSFVALLGVGAQFFLVFGKNGGAISSRRSRGRFGGTRRLFQRVGAFGNVCLIVGCE